MERPTDTLAEQADALAKLVLELAWAGEDAPLAEVLSGMTDTALIDLVTRIGSIANLADAIGTRVAGEFAARSARGGEEPLAKRLGERSAPIAVAALGHIAVRRAVDWCTLGQALGLRRSLIGAILPAHYPLVSEALDSGCIGTEAADLIADTLTAIAPERDLDQLAQDEQLLVQNALLLTTQGLGRLCKSLIAHADPDGSETREEELRAKAEIKVIPRRNGMTGIIAEADPESAGMILAAMDARTAPRREVRFVEEGEAEQDAAVADGRTLGQRRLDALVSIARDSVRHEPGDMSGTAVTMLVTVDYESLVSGVGTATISGVDAPISAKTARRLACDARIIPVVLGGDSVPLDLGQSRRLFSEAQRYAMAVRDGGCVWPGCTEPPGRCEAAHLTAWDQGPGMPHGPTDLANGVLMCRFHHRRLDNDGWEIRFENRVPYLIPPAWIDAARTPRRAGPPRLAA